MEKVKKLIFFRIPMSICNLRCHYCYLAQRQECYQGKQPEMKYSPQEVALALSPERVGGIAFINFCADGETLLTKGLHLYVKELLKEGHYCEVVTNLTISSEIEKYLEFDKDLLNRLEFKCSFHYLELKKKHLLNVFVNNVKKVWEAGASASIEITPNDELIPYIDEIKKLSQEEFGALPHITIARDDSTEDIGYLTQLSMDQYDKIWGSFDSGFWKYKKSIFGQRRKEFCYAGSWSLYVDISTGLARQCYCGKYLGNIFSDIKKPLPEEPIGRCQMPHCFNGHAFLTFGTIPDITKVRFGDIRNRVKDDGKEWLQPSLKCFFNTKLEDNNTQLLKREKRKYIIKSYPEYLIRRIMPWLRTMRMKKHK